MDTGRNPSTVRKQSPISFIPELLHHAGFGTRGNDAIQPTGSAFMSSTIHAQGLIQCRQWLNAGFHISDSAYHTGSLFQVRPSVTQTNSKSSCKRRKPKNLNKTVQPTASRAGRLPKFRFGLALSHGGCMRTRRAFAVPACNHAQFPGSCG